MQQRLDQPDHALLVGLRDDQGALAVGEYLLEHDDLAHLLAPLATGGRRVRPPRDDHGLADFDRVILDMLAPWDCVDDSGGCDVTGMSTQATRPAPHAASVGPPSRLTIRFP